MLLPDAVQATAQGRGRTLTVNNAQGRRTAISTSALDGMRTQPTENAPGRQTRANSEINTFTGLDLLDGTNMRGSDESSNDDEAMDTDDEDSVEFWGGESPRDRALSQRMEMEEDDDSSSDDSEDSDVVMEDDDDDDEEDELDLALIGHR